MPASPPTRAPARLHELSPEEQAIYRQLDPARIPQHVAIIMDGNGRWAGKRALKRFLGHQQGAECVQFVVETASRIDLPFLTLYAFSLENNLRRPKSEVSFLMKLLKSYLVGNVKRMNDNNVRMNYIGRTHELPAEVQDTMQWAMESTGKNTGTTLTLALNYGARTEIVDALRKILADLTAEAHTAAARSKTSSAPAASSRIDEPDISRALYTAACPTPTSSSAPPASSASPTSSSGRSPTPKSSSPTASGPTSAASISSKPSATTSAANAASAASAKTETDEERLHPRARRPGRRRDQI